MLEATSGGFPQKMVPEMDGELMVIPENLKTKDLGHPYLRKTLFQGWEWPCSKLFEPISFHVSQGQANR